METKKSKKFNFVGSILLPIVVTTVGLVIGLFINDFANNRAEKKLAKATLSSLQKDYDYNKKYLLEVKKGYQNMLVLFEDNLENNNIIASEIHNQYDKVFGESFRIPKGINTDMGKNIFSLGILNKVDYDILALIGRLNSIHDGILNEADYLIGLLRDQSILRNDIEIIAEKWAYINTLNQSIYSFEKAIELYEKYDQLIKDRKM